jgi:hypothetical protein
MVKQRHRAEKAEAECLAANERLAEEQARAAVLEEDLACALDAAKSEASEGDRARARVAALEGALAEAREILIGLRR